MEVEKNISRLDRVMTLLGVSATSVSQLCGVSASLISRWQKGKRPLTSRSEAALPLAAALIQLDKKDLLQEYLAAWQVHGESPEEALRLYLTDQPQPAQPNRSAPPEIQHTGSYVTEQQVLLGKKGFCKASLAMLDYLKRLPPGQQVVICAHHGFDLWHGNLPFAIQFILKMKEAVKQGTTFTLVNRDAPGMDGSPFFSMFWLGIHLKGILRTRYYQGDAPTEYFVGLIPGYWCAEAEADDTAVDGLLCTLSTDSRSARRAEAHCKAFQSKSVPATQYGFLQNPYGDKENKPCWTPEPLPTSKVSDALPTGNSFSAICSTPTFGVMTKEEFSVIAGKNVPAILPDFLFSDTGAFPHSAHRIILCREDVREGLLKARRRNVPLSALLHRTAYVPKAILAEQLGRMLIAMEQNERFEMALMPRSTFDKLEIELIGWHNSVSLGWMQNGKDSMLDDNPLVAGSFTSAINHTWGRLHQGWKRRSKVMATLRKWLAGKELDVQEKDSAIVKKWEVLPKE